MNSCNNNASEQIRTLLNQVTEKNPDGTYRRLGWQILTYIVGDILESSKDRDVRNLGCVLSTGAKNSFSDYLTHKISDWINKRLRDNSSPWY